MNHAQRHKFLNTADEHQKIIVDMIGDVSQIHGLDRVWSDWVEISAIALARIDKSQFEQREARYLEIVKRYTKEELDQLVQAFAHLVMVFEKNVEEGQLQDVLGKTFMMLDMGNSRSGQFFTPYEVSYMMAKIIMADQSSNIIKNRGFIRLAEPTSGAGGMIIAGAQALQDDGHNYQKAMHVTATDIDSRCVHMTYVQMALLHIPGIVIHGNALTAEQWQCWYTPAHIMGGWVRKLRQRTHIKEAVAPVTTEKAIQVATETGQFQLF